MTYPEPQPIDTATKIGWAFTGLVILALALTIWFTPPKPVPDPHTFRRETAVVNTVNIVNVYPEGDFTRVQYRGKPSDNDLFVEPPSHFLGPTRIVHATRLRQ